MIHPLGNECCGTVFCRPYLASNIDAQLRKATQAIPAGARFVGRGLVAVPRAIARFVVWAGRRKKQQKTKDNDQVEGDEISAVAALLDAEGSTTITTDQDTTVTNALRSVLLEGGDPIPETYAQGLVDRIQHVRNVSVNTFLYTCNELRS